MTPQSSAVSPTGFERNLDTNDDEKIVRGDDESEKVDMDQEFMVVVMAAMVPVAMS